MKGLLRSRDRKGAVQARAGIRIVRLENGHLLALFVDYVLDGGRDVLRFPQPACATVACPPLAIKSIQPRLAQTAAGISFEVGIPFTQP